MQCLGEIQEQEKKMAIVDTTVLKKKVYHTEPGIAFGSKQTRIKFTTSTVYLKTFLLNLDS